jgi:hypothetical protein
LKLSLIALSAIPLSLIGVWFAPSPERSAQDLFDKLYREVASHQHYDALESLQCSASPTSSIFSREPTYLCTINTSCEEPVEQRVFVDRLFGPRVGPDPFYQRFARTCPEILNVETAAKAADSIDQGG